MKWLTTNWTTLAMAVILSLVTVGLLSEPSQVETLIVTAHWKPDVRTSRVGSLQYWMDNQRITDVIPVTVTAERKDIPLQLYCQPILDDSKFPADETIREITLELTPRDFGLTTDMVRDIELRNPVIRVTFAPMTTRELPIRVSRQDVGAAEDSRYRVESIIALPPMIRVRLPFDKAQSLTSLPVRPGIPIGKLEGKRTETLQFEWTINTDLPEYKDVRPIQTFMVRMELKLIDVEGEEVDGIPLYLSAPDVPGLKMELLDRMTFKVELSGAADLVRALKERPELITVYARVDRPYWQEGVHQVPVRCDLPEEFRKDVTVKLAKDEPILASVRVTRS